MPVEASPPPGGSTRARVWRVAVGTVGVLSAVAIVIAARIRQPDLATAAASSLALVVAMAAVTSAGSGARGSAWLAALAYAWGAIAMQAAYLTPLTGLKWQHGWQYALAMALLAVGSLWLAGSRGPSAQEGSGAASDI